MSKIKLLNDSSRLLRADHYEIRMWLLFLRLLALEPYIGH